jgi:hypothetical protein
MGQIEAHLGIMSPQWDPCQSIVGQAVLENGGGARKLYFRISSALRGEKASKRLKLFSSLTHKDGFPYIQAHLKRALMTVLIKVICIQESKCVRLNYGICGTQT